VEGDQANEEKPAGADVADIDPNALRDINFDDGEFSQHPGLYIPT
jgi:hypothetical protein